MSRAWFLVLGLIVTIPAQVANAQEFGFFRYQDKVDALIDPSTRTSVYQDLKYIALDPGNDRYLSFGGDDREKFEHYSQPNFGLTRTGDYTARLHRFLLNANLRYDQLRVFTEFGYSSESGRQPGTVPTDVDRGDLQQLFVDWTLPSAAGPVTVRVGRQEMSYGEGLLIGVRDGPNIRQDWDGVRISSKAERWNIDSFAVRPVSNFPGSFDDHQNRQQSLWGIYVQSQPTASVPYLLDLYYFGTINRALRLGFASAEDRRATLGAKLYGAQNGFDGVFETIVQTGRYADRPVLAYALHTEAGRTWSDIDWHPRLGGKFDVISGNRNPDRGRVAAFNPLYPNLAYSTEATIEAATNLVESGISLAATPLESVTVNYELEGLWRQSTRDAFYVAPLIALIPLGASGRPNQRYSGLEQQIYTTWRANRFLSFKAAYVHFRAGSFLRAAGAKAIDYASAAASLRF